MRDRQREQQHGVCRDCADSRGDLRVVRVVVVRARNEFRHAGGAPGELEYRRIGGIDLELAQLLWPSLGLAGDQLGQRQAINTIGDRMKSHVLGVRDVDRPLALLLPGPTGVGKTELMMKFALAMNMPFFHVEGA